MKLLMVRHSATQGNLRKQYVGSQDHPLAPQGIEMAQQAHSRMPDIDGLWVSPMLRCRQTAEILFPKMEHCYLDDLRECNFGDFEGKTWDELKDHPIYRAWIDGDPEIAFPNGEILGEHIHRCRRGVETVLQQALSLGIQNPAIVAHGGTLMSAMSGFAVPHKEFYDWLPQNCGGYLVQVDWNPIRFTLLEEL